MSSVDLPWLIAPSDPTHNELELWYDGAQRLQVEIIDPDGMSIGTLMPGQSGTARRNGEVAVFVANRVDDPNNHDNTIGVYLAPAAGPGRWVLRLTSPAGQDVPFHAWIERDDTKTSRFEGPLDNGYTIGSISCGEKSIAVGSYDAHKSGQPISWFSSAGPTRDGRHKPEVSAPGHDVVAARSRSGGNGTRRESGTSMAAPAVTGSVALLLAAAVARGRDLTVDEIREAILDTARSAPPPAGEWDERYGQGRIGVADMARWLEKP